VENECILHNSIVLAVFVPKIIKVGRNLRKFRQKQFCAVFFETRCTYQKQLPWKTSNGHWCRINVFLKPATKKSHLWT